MITITQPVIDRPRAPRKHYPRLNHKGFLVMLGPEHVEILERLNKRRQGVTGSPNNRTLVIKEALICLDRLDRGELIVNPDYNRDREK